MEFPGRWYKYSVAGKYHTEPPTVVRFEHDLCGFNGPRAQSRCRAVHDCQTNFEQQTILSTSSRRPSAVWCLAPRPGRLDDAVDILSQCGELLPNFILEMLSQPQATGIDEDYWYVLIRGVGKSALPSASIFVEMLSSNSPEAGGRVLGDIGSEQALKRLRAVAAHGRSPFIRQLAAGIIDECSE